MAKWPSDRHYPLSLSRTKISRRTLLKGAVSGAGALLLRPAGGAYAASRGPSSSVDAYVLPSQPGVETMAILTVNDKAANGYRMAGIPDGLGAIHGNGAFELFMNHEIPDPLGARRAHGSIGAFVSNWTIDTRTMSVLQGQDLTPSAGKVFLWDNAEQQYRTGTTQWQRLCSADLPLASAFAQGSLGAADRIFMDGEEFDEGRAWARIATGPNAGEAWQLPRLGKMAWENAVACPNSGEKTVVLCMDDASLPPAGAPIAGTSYSQVFVYIGTKQETGSPIERAGLTNGKLYGVRVYRGSAVVEQEANVEGLGTASTGLVTTGRFELVEMGTEGNVAGLTGAQLHAEAVQKKLTRFMRDEDAAWDPRPDHGYDSYFVTTASITLNSRLWRLRFDSLLAPEQGGSIDILLNATMGRMFDNITIDRFGRLFLQEDTGNDPYVSKIRVYGLESRIFLEVAHHDEQLFVAGGARFITQDEESSGIIDATDILGPGWYLLDVQVHKADPDPGLVEGGQLVAMYVPTWIGLI